MANIPLNSIKFPGLSDTYIIPDTDIVAETYSSGSLYAVGDYCIYNNALYRCSTAITTAEAWTAGHWTAVAMANEVSQLNADLTQTDTRLDDVVLMASINHSLKLPTDVKGVDVTSENGWTFADTTGTVTKNYYDPVNRIHRNCIAITSTSNGIAYYDLDNAVDATTKPLLISIALDQLFDITSGRSVSIALYSGTGRTSTYRKEIYLQWEGTDGSFNSKYYMNGFFNLCLFTESGTYKSQGSAYDPTNVTAIGVHLYHASGTTRTLYIADMKFVEPMQKGGIVTIVDNFASQVPQMADYAYSKGVRLNLSIIPGYYDGSSSAPICAAQSYIDTAKSQGHFIWNHTYEHLVFNNLTDLEIANQINNAQTWMNINGYERGAKYLSVPSASFNTDSFNSVVKTNVNMIFHQWGYMGGYAYAPFYPCIRQVPTTMLDSSNSDPTDLISHAQKGVTYGGISVLGFHGTYWDIDDGVSWKAYIDGIADISNAYHYRLDEIFDGQWC